jgi:hypothetical protein
VCVSKKGRPIIYLVSPVCSSSSSKLPHRKTGACEKRRCEKRCKLISLGIETWGCVSPRSRRDGTLRQSFCVVLQRIGWRVIDEHTAPTSLPPRKAITGRNAGRRKCSQSFQSSPANRKLYFYTPFVVLPYYFFIISFFLCSSMARHFPVSFRTREKLGMAGS